MILRTLAIILATVVVFIGVWSGRNQSSSVLSSKSQVDQEGDMFVTREPQPTQQISVVTPTSASPKPPSPTPTSVSPKTQTSNSDLVYPESQIVVDNGSQLTIRSSDSADQITSWYKQKLTSLGLGVSSFVQTSTNDNVLNKLVVAGNGLEYQIEISKESGQDTVEVQIVIQKD